MIQPSGRDSSRRSGSSELPATYRSPWRSLGENLQAVLADLRLRARELWRRNGEADLWRPGWWPRDLAPLFWPLLLSLVLAAVLLSALALRHLTPAAEVPTSMPLAEAPAASEPSAPEVRAPDSSGTTPPSLSTSPPTPLPTAEPVPEPVPATEPLPDSPSLPDPLTLLLQRPEAAGLLQVATAQPDQLSLVLQVSPAFLDLPASRQQSCAELWQQWAAELGYEHLELRDPRSGLLARDALVGSGMIVLHEPSRP